MITDQCGLCGKDVQILAHMNVVWICYGVPNRPKNCYSTWQFPIPSCVLGLPQVTARMGQHEKAVK